MTMRRLLVQIWTYEDMPGMLQLLEYPGEALLPREYQVKVERWREGKSYRGKYASLDKFRRFLESKLAQDRANQVFVSFRFEPYTVAGHAIEVHGINTTLLVSPKSRFWGKVYGYRLDGRMDEAKRASYESFERSVLWAEIERDANVLLCDVVFSSPLETSEVWRAVSDILYSAMPPRVLEVGIGACVDMAEVGALPILLPFFPGVPEARQRLDEEFPGLHPILVGKEELCRKLARRLGEKATVRGTWACPDGRSYGLVYLREVSDVDELAVSDLLVKQDANVALDVDRPENGDYRLGRKGPVGVYYTKKRFYGLLRRQLLPYRRWHDLIAALGDRFDKCLRDGTLVEHLKGPLPYPGEVDVPFTLIPEEYREALVIPEDSALIAQKPAWRRGQLYGEIEQEYLALSEIGDDTRRRLEAIRRAYEKVMNPYGLNDPESDRLIAILESLSVRR